MTYASLERGNITLTRITFHSETDSNLLSTKVRIYKHIKMIKIEILKKK